METKQNTPVDTGVQPAACDALQPGEKGGSLRGNPVEGTWQHGKTKKKHVKILTLIQNWL